MIRSQWATYLPKSSSVVRCGGHSRATQRRNNSDLTYLCCPSVLRTKLLEPLALLGILLLSMLFILILHLRSSVGAIRRNILSCGGGNYSLCSLSAHLTNPYVLSLAIACFPLLRHRKMISQLDLLFAVLTLSILYHFDQICFCTWER